MFYNELKAAIQDRTATVSVIGQGYVGLPLALSFVDSGFNVFGIDVDSPRVDALQSGDSYIGDVTDAELMGALTTGRYRPTTDFSVIRQSQVVSICVPTPLRKSKDPDISFIVGAVAKVKENMHPGILIILESTTYPGTTEELVVAEIEKLGYTVGEDFFVCFSPERVDPGNAVYHTANTPKVVGGVTQRCLDLGTQCYGSVMERIVPVSTARVAEMVKLLENTFRAVNIGLVNELALMCERMEIDIWEVIDAAATKPFGFMPFYPGPGIGGHCIPLDPLYLSWKAKMHGFFNKFIELASDINANMPRHVVAKVSEALNLDGKAVRNSRILILGMAYKRDVSDHRETPSLEILKLLQQQGAIVDYHDPLVPVVHEDATTLEGIALDEAALVSYDCVVLATNHSGFDYSWIAEKAKLVVDTRNAFKGIDRPNIIRLGVETPASLDREAIHVS